MLSFSLGRPNSTCVLVFLVVSLMLCAATFTPSSVGTGGAIIAPRGPNDVRFALTLTLSGTLTTDDVGIVAPVLAAASSSSSATGRFSFLNLVEEPGDFTTVYYRRYSLYYDIIDANVYYGATMPASAPDNGLLPSRSLYSNLTSFSPLITSITAVLPSARTAMLHELCIDGTFRSPSCYREGYSRFAYHSWSDVIALPGGPIVLYCIVVLVFLLVRYIAFRTSHRVTLGELVDVQADITFLRMNHSESIAEYERRKLEEAQATAIAKLGQKPSRVTPLNLPSDAPTDDDKKNDGRGSNGDDAALRHSHQVHTPSPKSDSVGSPRGGGGGGRRGSSSSSSNVTMNNNNSSNSNMDGFNEGVVAPRRPSRGPVAPASTEMMPVARRTSRDVVAVSSRPSNQPESPPRKGSVTVTVVSTASAASNRKNSNNNGNSNSNSNSNSSGGGGGGGKRASNSSITVVATSTRVPADKHDNDAYDRDDDDDRAHRAPPSTAGSRRDSQQGSRDVRRDSREPERRGSRDIRRDSRDDRGDRRRGGSGSRDNDDDVIGGGGGGGRRGSSNPNRDSSIVARFRDINNDDSGDNNDDDEAEARNLYTR